MESKNKRPFVLGIAGPTCSGKTSLTNALSRLVKTHVVALDSYHNARSHVVTFPSGRKWINWETSVGVDYDAMIREVNEAINNSAANGVSLVIVEGFLILEHPELVSLLDHVVALVITKDVCYRRRVARRSDSLSDYLVKDSTPEVPSNWLELYFEDAVWPNALKFNIKFVPKDTQAPGLVKETTNEKVCVVNGELDASVLVEAVATHVVQRAVMVV